MSRQIFLDAPDIGEHEKRYLNKAIDDGYVSTVGPFVEKFEKDFASYLNITKAVSVQSGTAAIHMGLHELGIKECDEVIVPALTFVATVNPVMYLRARPVFVDVDVKTWNIDPKEIERSITKRTKVIIPVHFYGNPCNMDEIMDIARRNDLYVIEDATESLGARYRDKYTGTIGDIGCFSFNGNKIITTGGGGMVVGHNTRRLEHVKFLVNQARDTSKGYYHPEIGFNYRMTNIEAALGLAQMKRLEEFLAKKRNFNRIYRDEFRDLDFIRFQEEPEGSKSSHWLSCVIFDRKLCLSALQDELKRKGIATRRIFMPVVEFPPYKKKTQKNYPNAYYIYERGLCLPSSVLNSESDIERVAGITKRSILNQFKVKI